MNIATQAHSLYGQARNLKSPRDLEYEVFAGITSRLRAALADQGSARFPRLVAALHDNRKLWTALATDIAHPDNALAPDLKARLLYLAEYTFDVTDRILTQNHDGTALIEVNTIIMRGLRGEITS
jgi:flagellar protein FlaF